MRITVVRSGGLAGMVTTTVVDTADLDAAGADGMRAAVAACAFVVPGEAGPGPVRDGQAYEVAVLDDDGAERRVRFTEGGSRPPEGLRDLVRRVEDCPAGRRSLGR